MDDHPTSLAALEDRRAAWAALWARDPAATPFQSPAWLIPWWRHFGGGELVMAEAREDGRLIALAPMFVHRDAGLRKLMPVGISVSDYLDATIDPAVAARARHGLFDGLMRCRDRWDVCEFQDLRPDSPLLADPPPGWETDGADGAVCPVLALPPRVEEMARAVPRITIKNLKEARRRAAKLGPVRLERADAGNFDALFDALVRLHGARWTDRGEAGVLADETVQRFHREAASAFLELGILRLYGLRIGDAIVAVYYGFADRGRAYAYLSGFDPGYEKQSFGTLIVGHAIEEAVREGLAEFHFLRGGEGYKYAWGAKDRVNRTLRLRPSAEAVRSAS